MQQPMSCKNSKDRLREALDASDFAGETKILDQIMEDDWVVLRALALGDQFPDADVETLLRMAEEQSAARTKA